MLNAWRDEAHVVVVWVGKPDRLDFPLVNLLIDNGRQSLEAVPLLQRRRGH